SISLASHEDGLYHIGAFAGGTTKPVFFYLKATGAVASETHTVHVYSGKPGSSGSTEVGSQTFSLTAVTDLEASSNKVTGGSVSPSSGLELGGQVVVTVDGDTGQVISTGP